MADQEEVETRENSQQCRLPLKKRRIIMGEEPQPQCRCPQCAFHSQDHDAYLNSIPAGYRFTPTDEVLVMNYLAKKARNEHLPINRIHVLNLYEHDPRQLSVDYAPWALEDNTWYFFSPRERKYLLKGSKPSRGANGGFWKDTRGEMEINVNGARVAYKNRLVFYTVPHQPADGRRSNRHNAQPTNWIMFEYRLDPDLLPIPTGEENALLELPTWVLCKIYESTTDTKKDAGN